MSWSASGRIEGKPGPNEGWGDSLEWSPPRDQLKGGPKAQADFLVGMIGSAFGAGLLDGAYSASLAGHDDPDQKGDRKYLSLNLTPITMATPEPEPEAPEPERAPKRSSRKRG